MNNESVSCFSSPGLSRIFVQILPFSHRVRCGVSNVIHQHLSCSASSSHGHRSPQARRRRVLKRDKARQRLLFDNDYIESLCHLLVMMEPQDEKRTSTDGVLACQQRYTTPKNVVNEVQYLSHRQRAPDRKRKRAFVVKDDCPCLHRRITRALQRAACVPEDEHGLPQEIRKASLVSHCPLAQPTHLTTDIRARHRPNSAVKHPQHSMAILATSTALARICHNREIAHTQDPNIVRASSLEFGPLL